VTGNGSLQSGVSTTEITEFTEKKPDFGSVCSVCPVVDSNHPAP